eukprot:Tamp_17792.p1 GENE.Tamp_17792~~Tamp_17792.p1  ORF type:complete len:340 (-),score=31.39 Tamp_17792:103-1122(-)
MSLLDELLAEAEGKLAEDDRAALQPTHAQPAAADASTVYAAAAATPDPPPLSRTSTSPPSPCTDADAPLLQITGLQSEHEECDESDECDGFDDDALDCCAGAPALSTPQARSVLDSYRDTEQHALRPLGSHAPAMTAGPSSRARHSAGHPTAHVYEHTRARDPPRPRGEEFGGRGVEGVTSTNADGLASPKKGGWMKDSKGNWVRAVSCEAPRVVRADDVHAKELDEALVRRAQARLQAEEESMAAGATDASTAEQARELQDRDFALALSYHEAEEAEDCRRREAGGWDAASHRTHAIDDHAPPPPPPLCPSLCVRKNKKPKILQPLSHDRNSRGPPAR